MLRPNSKEWDILFSHTTEWDVVHVEPFYQPRSLACVTGLFSGEVYSESSKESSIELSLKQGITRPTCFLLSAGIHEMPAIALASNFPVVFKAAESHEQSDTTNGDPSVSASSLVILTGSFDSGTCPLTISGPGGVFVEGVSFACGPGGCVNVRSGPTKLVNCTFRVSGQVDNAGAITICHHTSIHQCLFDQGGVGVVIRAEPGVEVTVEDSYFRSDKLTIGIQANGDAHVRLSNLAFEGLIGVGVHVSGKSFGYLRRSLFSGIRESGVVIEGQSTLSVSQCKFIGQIQKQGLLRGAALTAGGSSTPKIIRNSFHFESPRHRARCLVVFTDKSEPVFSDNHLYDHAKCGATGFRADAEPNSSLLAVCGESNGRVSQNTFQVNSLTTRSIVIGGISSAIISNNRFQCELPSDVKNSAALPCCSPIALGPHQRSQCHDNAFLHEPQIKSQVYVALSREPSLLRDDVGTEVPRRKKADHSPSSGRSSSTPRKEPLASQADGDLMRSSDPKGVFVVNRCGYSKEVRNAAHYERKVAYLNSIISQLQVRLRLRNASNRPATAPPDDTATKCAGRFSARPPSTCSPNARKLTTTEQASLAHRLYNEGCERHQHAIERAHHRAQSASPRRSLSPPLDADEIRLSNQRLYYEEIEHRRETMETLRRRYELGVEGENSPKNSKRLGKHAPVLTPRPPRIVRSQSDIEMYCASLYMGHKDNESTHKAAAVINTQGQSGALHVLARRERTVDDIYPSQRKVAAKKSKEELDCMSFRLFKGLPK